MTVTSTTVFTAWEYRYVCWEADGDRYMSAVGNTWPANPTPSGLDETAWWTVRTGGEDNQCFSRPQAAQVWLYVRVKSASTSWSDWVYHPLSIELSPVAPTFSMVSHNMANKVGYGETVEVSALVHHSSRFTRVQQYVSCQNRDGGDVVLRGPSDGKSPVFTRSSSRTRDWDVTTGDGSGECSHKTPTERSVQVTLLARAWTSSGWSQWGSFTVPVAPPACTVDVPVDTNTTKQDQWFVDCTDMHDPTGVYKAKRYRVTLPNSTGYFPMVINVSSKAGFKITLVGGSPSVRIDSKEGSSQGPVRGGSYSGRMVKALGVAHTTYTIEISTTETNTTGPFGMVIEWFDLQPPTNLKANGHTTPINATLGESMVTWRPAYGAKGYKTEYLACALPQTCSNVVWPSQTTTKSRATLSNLRLNTLYQIKVWSTLDGHTSDESTVVYTYPTTEPPLLDTVATQTFAGYWFAKSYNYLYCSDPIPLPTTTTTMPTTIVSTTTTTRVDWEGSIRQGLAKWPSVTDNMVRVRRSVEKCDDNGSGFIGADELETNMVFVTSDAYTRSYCMFKQPNAIGACAKPKFEGTSRVDTKLVFGVGLETLSDYTLCLTPYRVAVHEAGHAFGLLHSMLTGSVMYEGDFCNPHEYDIVAIKALYQSVQG